MNVDDLPLPVSLAGWTYVRSRVDWRELFLEFSRQHGGNPMNWKGRLLWGDGWTHSATDHKGPAWPPPEDQVELLKMQRWYWKRRLAAVTAELRRESSRLADYKALAERFPELTWLKTSQWDEETRSHRLVEPQVAMEALAERVSALEKNRQDCSRMLEELNAKSTKSDAVAERS